MTLRRPRRAALLLAATLTAAFAGCGADPPPASEPVREGLGIDVGGLTYNVYITRQLNLRDVEDRTYYKGAEAPPGSVEFGFSELVVNHGSQSEPSRTSAAPIPSSSPGDTFEKSR